MWLNSLIIRHSLRGTGLKIVDYLVKKLFFGVFFKYPFFGLVII